MDHHFRTCLFAVLAAVLVTACKTDLPADEQSKASTTITFVVGGDEAATKAAGEAKVMEPVDLSADTGVEGLMLTETVTSLDGELFPAQDTDTKGTPIYTENFDALIGGFAATAFKPKSDGSKLTDAWGSDFGSNGTVQFNKSGTRTYSYNYSDSGATGVNWNLAWPEPDRQLLYFFQAPYSLTSALSPEFHAPDEDHPMGSIHFSYTSPVSSNGTSDAEAQKDLLFTSKIISESSKDEDNHILFYHALTGVKFKAGNFGDNITRIKKVVIHNVVGSGDCVISPSYSGGANTAPGNQSNAGTAHDNASKSAQCALWSSLGSPDKTFTQVFGAGTFGDGIVNEYSKGSNAGAVPSSFSENDTALHNLNDAMFTKTFMLVPQTCGEDASVTVYYTINEVTDPTVYERTVSLSGIVWKAGELHTYTLTVNDVRVDISDTMSPDLRSKTAIQTRNTGNATAYMRCALSANWIYDDPDTQVNENVIVSHCNIFNTGTFYKNEEHGLGFKTNWILGSDGYVYYKNPIKAGKATTYSLFHKYEAPDTSPYPGAHLEIAIALQGVQFDESKAKVKAAWNVDTVDALDVSFDMEGNMITSESGMSIADILSTTPEN